MYVRTLARRAFTLILGTLPLGVTAQAVAADYPAGPIRVVVAFGPGGIADTIARLGGQKLNEKFGQPIVTDNRPGAGGAVGAKLVAGANPTGYTLLVTTAAVAVNAAASAEAVDPRSQLVPIAVGASAPTIIAAHRSATAKTLMDLVKSAKGGRFTFSTAGIGTTEHLASEYIFRAVQGVEGTHVPYQGGAAPVTALMSQQVDLTTTSVPTALPFIKQGAIRVLAMVARKRHPLLPDVPTIAEAGLPNIENSSWVAFFAPARTPAAAVQTLNAAINDAMRQQDVRDRLSGLGFDQVSMTQPQFADYIRSEVEKWATVIKSTGINPN